MECLALYRAKLHCQKKVTVLLKILPKVLLWYSMIWIYLILCASWYIFYFEKGIIHYYVRKILQKINISHLLIRTRTCAYQGVGNVSLSEYFAHVLCEWSQGLYSAMIFWKLFCSSLTWFGMIYCNDWIEVKLKRLIRIS